MQGREKEKKERESREVKTSKKGEGEKRIQIMRLKEISQAFLDTEINKIDEESEGKKEGSERNQIFYGEINMAEMVEV